MSTRLRTHGALAVASRVELLDALRGSPRPLDAHELATACGLHVSTVRFHLDVLGEAGLVRGAPAAPRSRGRPRILYSPVSGGANGDGSGQDNPQGYQLLATILAEHWADAPAERARMAKRAGRALATRHRLRRTATQPPTADQSLARVTGLFGELGFEPEQVRVGRNVQLRLHACPFRAVAIGHPDVVCSLHLGLLRGVLAELEAPLRVRSLQPFVEPHVCVANLSPRPRARPGGAVQP